MTGQQRAVLWIGLILVGLNLVGHWTEIRTVIFNGAGIFSGGGSSGNGSGGGFQIPGIPMIPGTHLPLTFLNQPSQKTKKSNVQVM
jgi:hypothetical protein